MVVNNFFLFSHRSGTKEPHREIKRGTTDEQRQETKWPCHTAKIVPVEKGDELVQCSSFLSFTGGAAASADNITNVH